MKFTGFMFYFKDCFITNGLHNLKIMSSLIARLPVRVIGILKTMIFQFKAPISTVTNISSNLHGVGEGHYVFLLH